MKRDESIKNDLVNVRGMFGKQAIVHLNGGYMQSSDPIELINYMHDTAFLHGNKLFGGDDYNVLNKEDREIMLRLKVSVKTIVDVLSKYDIFIWKEDEDILISKEDYQSLKFALSIVDNKTVGLFEEITMLTVLYCRPDLSNDVIYQRSVDVYFFFTLLRDVFLSYNKEC